MLTPSYIILHHLTSLSRKAVTPEKSIVEAFNKTEMGMPGTSTVQGRCHDNLVDMSVDVSMCDNRKHNNKHNSSRSAGRVPDLSFKIKNLLKKKTRLMRM